MGRGSVRAPFSPHERSRHPGHHRHRGKGVRADGARGGFAAFTSLRLAMWAVGKEGTGGEGGGRAGHAKASRPHAHEDRRAMAHSAAAIASLGSSFTPAMTMAPHIPFGCW